MNSFYKKPPGVTDQYWERWLLPARREFIEMVEDPNFGLDFTEIMSMEEVTKTINEAFEKLEKEQSK